MRSQTAGERRKARERHHNFLETQIGLIDKSVEADDPKESDRLFQVVMAMERAQASNLQITLDRVKGHVPYPKIESRDSHFSLSLWLSILLVWILINVGVFACIAYAIPK